jgi:hypothetical protein
MCMHMETYRHKSVVGKGTKCLQVDIKTLMLAKCRQTTHIQGADDKLGQFLDQGI